MSPLVLMIFVLIAAALVFAGPDPLAKQKELEARYGKDQLAREIGMRNDGLIEGANPLDGEYMPPKGAKVYKLPDYMVVKTDDKKNNPLDMLDGEKPPEEAAPPVDIPMAEWGKPGSTVKTEHNANSGIKYESGLPATFAQPSPPKPVPVEPLSGQ